jgi:hypothetical protein
MSLATRGGQEVVRGVEHGSPAEAAGVRPGDILLAAGGEAALNLRQVAAALQHSAADPGDADPDAVRLLVGRPRPSLISIGDDGPSPYASASTSRTASPAAANAATARGAAAPANAAAPEASEDASTSALPTQLRGAEWLLTQVLRGCQAGAAESKAALHYVRQRVRAERTAAEAYAAQGGGGGGGGRGWEMALGAPAALAAPHAALAALLTDTVAAPLARRLAQVEASTRRATATAQRMSRETRATQEALARARAELRKRLRESEAAQAEYHRASSYVSSASGGRRRPAAEDKAGRAAAERLSRVCQRLEVAVARTAQQDAAYSAARELSVIQTWKFCTLQMPALCCALKAEEHARAEEVRSLQWRAIEALGRLPAQLSNTVEEMTRHAAGREGELWLEATL